MSFLNIFKKKRGGMTLIDKNTYLAACFNEKGYHFSSGNTHVEDNSIQFSFAAKTQHIFLRSYSTNMYYTKFFTYTPIFLLALRDRQILSDFYDKAEESFRIYGESNLSTITHYFYDIWLDRNDFRMEGIPSDVRYEFLAYSSQVANDEVVDSLWKNLVDNKEFTAWVNDKSNYDTKTVIDHINARTKRNDYRACRALIVANLLEIHA